MLKVNIKPYKKKEYPDNLLLMEYKSPIDGKEDWALLMPPENNSECVIMLHGHGAQADQLYKREDLRRTWVNLLSKNGRAILTPNLRGNAWMNSDAEKDLLQLIKFMKKEYNQERFILASGSMGGTGSLIFAALHPDIIAGVVALCPATDLNRFFGWCRSRKKDILHKIADAIENSYGRTPEDSPDNYRAHSTCANFKQLKMPVYISHGTADTIIPASESRELIGRMAGMNNLCYEEIPNGNHDAPIEKMEKGIKWINDPI